MNLASTTSVVETIIICLSWFVVATLDYSVFCYDVRVRSGDSSQNNDDVARLDVSRFCEQNGTNGIPTPQHIDTAQRRKIVFEFFLPAACVAGISLVLVS